MLICNLKRIKIDVNRDRETGTEGHQVTKIYWDKYHEFADIAKADITEHAGKAYSLTSMDMAIPLPGLKLGIYCKRKICF